MADTIPITYLNVINAIDENNYLKVSESGSVFSNKNSTPWEVQKFFLPEWAPEGTYFIFASQTDGYYSIHSIPNLINLDTSLQLEWRLYDHEWSANDLGDGEKIVGKGIGKSIVLVADENSNWIVSQITPSLPYSFNLGSVGNVNNGGRARRVWGDGTYIYLANGDKGLYAYTFNGSIFTEVGHIDSGGYAYSVWGDGSYIYLANDTDGLRAYEFNGATFIPKGLFREYLHANAKDVWGDGEYVYLADYYSGLRALTFDGSTFVQIDKIDLGYVTRDVWGDGSYIYITTSDDVYALSFNEASFEVEGQLDPGFAYEFSIWGDGTYIYIGGNNHNGLMAYTFDGTNFSEKSRIIEGFVLGVWGDGTYIYTANSSEGIGAYTFDGTIFTKKGRSDDGGSAIGVWGDDTYIYLANDTGGLRAYSKFSF
jgi:hypothetical protein